MHPAEQRLLGCAYPPSPHPPAASPRRKWQSIVIIAAGLRATDTTHYAAPWHSLMEILDHWPCQQVKCYVCDLNRERGAHEGIRMCVGRAAIWQKNIYWKQKKKASIHHFPELECWAGTARGCAKLVTLMHRWGLSAGKNVNMHSW